MKRFILFVVIAIAGIFICSCEDERKSPDYTGNWQKGEFVDEFKTKTGEIFFKINLWSENGKNK
jgi:hypothetical protein